MDLDFSEEQVMLRDLVRGLCEELCPLEKVRELEDDPIGFPKDLWAKLGELGVIGLMLPEAYGGSGQSTLEGAVLYEELGRALAPTPHFASAVLSGGAILRAGSDEQRQAWLPGIASGELIVVPAALEPDRSTGPKGVALGAEPDGDGFRLTGTKRHVPYAAAADRLLVLARSGDGDADIDLFLVDPKAEGVTLTQQRTLATDTQYRVDLEKVQVAASDRLGKPGSGWATWDAVMMDGAILLGAQAMGGAERALEMTVEYAKVREQFGKPIGAFQAISHYLADGATTVNGGKVLVQQAAWARANDRPIQRLAPMAKLFACQTYRDVTAMCEQVHGGIGFTVEHDIQLFFRRAKQLQLSWWDSRELEERVAATVLDDAIPI